MSRVVAGDEMGLEDSAASVVVEKRADWAALSWTILAMPWTRGWLDAVKADAVESDSAVATVAAAAKRCVFMIVRIMTGNFPVENVGCSFFKITESHFMDELWNRGDLLGLRPYDTSKLLQWICGQACCGNQSQCCSEKKRGGIFCRFVREQKICTEASWELWVMGIEPTCVRNQ